MERSRRRFLIQSLGATSAVVSGCAQTNESGPTSGESPSQLLASASPATSTAGEAAVVAALKPRPLLQESDISYLGYYNIQTDGMDSTYYQGLQVRTVGGETRLLVVHLKGRVVEIPVDSYALGSSIDRYQNSWDVSPYLNWYHNNIWWDEEGNRLWTLNADGYTTEANPCRIYTMTLGEGGRLSNIKGPVGLANVSSKRTRSGVLSIPPEFRAAFNVGPYAIGLGGYTSLMAAGGSCAMGLSLYAIPDPAGYANNAQIPVGAYKALAARGDSPRGRRIWYGYDFATQTGKGPINYFDGGGFQENFRPTREPNRSGNWLSPDSGGRAYWLWGDKYVGGVWLNGKTKSGLLLIGDFGMGYGWYQNSALAWDDRGCEAHIFDPVHLGEVLRGARRADSVEPVSMKALPETDSGGGESAYGRACYAAFDSATNRLFILKAAMNGPYAGRIYVYRVAA